LGLNQRCIGLNGSPTRVEKQFQHLRYRERIEKADIIVSRGRRLGSADGFKLLKKLAN